MNRYIKLAAIAAVSAIAVGCQPGQAIVSLTSPDPVVAAPTPTAATTTYRVVGTGDSIFALSGSYLRSTDRWLDWEQGRQIDVRGTQGRASHAELWPGMLARSRPNGWIIFQENGAQVTDARYRQFVRQMVLDTPNDRCIVAVLPVFHPDWSPAAADNASRKANILVQELGAQPCRAFVRWNQKVMADPSLVYDGQHPTAAGSAWLGQQIDLIVGPRI